MFFRGRQPEAAIWQRFRTSADGFAFTEVDGLFTAHVVANAERVVDLFHTLAEELPPTIDVAIDDRRSGRSWKGESIALPDVREAVARLRVLLGEFGGVELSAFTSEDQLTLTPQLELFIYARTDRWLYLLERKGLEEREGVQSKSWKSPDQHFPAAPALVSAVGAAADRLGLVPA